MGMRKKKIMADSFVFINFNQIKQIIILIRKIFVDLIEEMRYDMPVVLMIAFLFLNRNGVS